MAVYFIGGSPCSGKSTTAQAISQKYGMHYFKVDDQLDAYIKTAARAGKTCCVNVEEMTPEQIWMRKPDVQCEEELQIYDEIFPYILSDLKKICENEDVITEGAAYLPRLIKALGIPVNRYISMTPTKEFQVYHYRKREWVPYVLQACSDQAKAFDNWMERDALFAKVVQQQCRDLGYASVINDGLVPPEEMVQKVIAHFELG